MRDVAAALLFRRRAWQAGMRIRSRTIAASLQRYRTKASADRTKTRGAGMLRHVSPARVCFPQLMLTVGCLLDLGAAELLRKRFPRACQRTQFPKQISEQQLQPFANESAASSPGPGPERVLACDLHYDPATRAPKRIACTAAPEQERV